MTDETEGQKIEVDADLKAELLAKADRLGVKVDKRWAVGRIEAAIADAAGADPQPVEDEASPADQLAMLKAELAGVKEQLASRDDVIASQKAYIAELEAALVAPAPAPVVRQADVKPAFTPEPPPSPRPMPQPAGTVRCRVTQNGNDQIFTGLDDPPRYKWGAIVHLPPETAQSLKAKGWVEIGTPDD